MPEPQVTSKTIKPPDLLNPDLEDIQKYAVNLFIEKLAISLGFAILSALIVLITALFNDIRFMTAFFRAITAFFVAGITAALISNVLDMQQDYFNKDNPNLDQVIQSDTTVQATNINQNQNDETNQKNQSSQNNDEKNNSGGFSPLNAQSLPNINQK